MLPIELAKSKVEAVIKPMSEAGAAADTIPTPCSPSAPRWMPTSSNLGRRSLLLAPVCRREMSAQMNRHRKATVAARAFERAAPRHP